MAGLIAAHGRGEHAGALGIAPKAKILPVMSSLSDNREEADDLAAGVEYATSHGADVISISSAGGSSVRLTQAVKAALAANIIVVAGVGNRPEASSVGYPASEDGVIAVGGIDRTGKHAPVSVTGPEIDVVAPAVDIYSTSYAGKYSKGPGTSGATAIVAGAAALIRSKYPYLSAQEVAHRLTATAIDKGPPGRDDEYGYGVIDLVAALTADVPPLGFETAAASVPTTTTAAEPASNGDNNGTARGLATLGVLVAVGRWLPALAAASTCRRPAAAGQPVASSRCLNSVPLRLVLASQSPARRKLLQAAGIEPDVLVSGVDESQVVSDRAEELCLELARLKAQAVLGRLRADAGRADAGARLRLGARVRRGDPRQAGRRGGRHPAVAADAGAQRRAAHRALPDRRRPGRRGRRRSPPPPCTSPTSATRRSPRTWRPVSRWPWPARSPSTGWAARS